MDAQRNHKTPTPEIQQWLAQQQQQEQGASTSGIARAHGSSGAGPSCVQNGKL